MSSLEAFLSGIIDYAGLFPPAQLPLELALENFVAHVSEKDSWLLGRFVCPASRLQDAARLLKGVKPPKRLEFAVLGRGGQDAQEFFNNVKADLADITRFHETLDDKVRVQAYEVRLPPSAFNPLRSNQLASLIATTAYLIDTSGPSRLTPFFESPATDRASLVAVIQALHDDRHSIEAGRRSRCEAVGFKLRTGGLEAAAFPSSEQVALALAACAAARVPFKATAGLHHPMRQFQSEVGATMHGFANLFAAGCLALIHRLDEPSVRAIVEDENPAHFEFLKGGLRWQALTATIPQISEARKTFSSFGSCSLEEPRDGLRQLGWLD